MPHHFLPGLAASPWHHSSDARFPKLAPLFSLLREAAPVMRKEYNKLRRQRLLQTDEDCIQQPAALQAGRWRRFEVGAIWQNLNGTGCSVDAPAGCALLARLRASGAAPILRAGYSAIGPGGCAPRWHHTVL